ncbi:hypothetical protein DOY81_002314 [Sarcophaga bullata]|nr:hypothetical protein DOY81_002314 [Sarcophaga bullata]
MIDRQTDRQTIRFIRRASQSASLPASQPAIYLGDETDTIFVRNVKNVCDNAPSYNMSIPAPYEISPSAATSYGVGSQYKTPGLSTLNYERSVAAVRTTPYNQPQQMSTSEMQNKPLAQHHSQQFGGVSSSTKQRSSSLIGSSSNVSTSKPQAAATPFYAQPLAQSHTNTPTAYYDNVKQKMALEYHEAYSNNSPAATNTYHQQQKYYAAAKSQLKEAAAYGSPAAVGLSGKSLYTTTGNFFPASPTTYDKYLYPPHVPATGYSTSQHVGNETPPDQSNYRKPVAANQLNSTSWPWGIDYNAGNSRTIPPPPTNHIPTATVAPTHATYLTPNPTSLTREPFYMNPEKYALKYDKYGVPPAYQQTYVNPSSSRHHMWPSTAAANNLAPLNERHPMATVPTVPPHGLHSSPYFSANSASALNSRQSCCNQPYQTQNCYYPAPTHATVNRLPYNQPATVAPSTGGFLTSQQSHLGQSPHLNALTASCKFGGILTDYGNVNKVKNTNDLYLSSHRYDTNPPPPPPHNYGYGSGHSNQSLYASNTHQSMVHGPHDPMPANSTNYTNDLSLTTSNFDSYHSHLDNHLGPQTLAGIQQHNPQQQQQQQSPPPAYTATVAKRALLDYRKPIQPQPPPPPPTINEECYPAFSATTITTRDHHHYNQHDVLNTPETTTTFNEYESPQESSSYIAHKSQEVMDETNSVAGSNEGKKNLSLRDFIANWNDDEEEYQNNEEISFDQSSVIQEVLQTSPNEQEQGGAVAMEVVALDESTEVVKSLACSIETKDDNQIIDKDFTATAPAPAPSPTSASAPTSNEVESDNSQYANLPDIIIDIEKSNSVTNSTVNLATNAVQEHAGENSTSLNLTDFDVEKELDELKIKKPMPQDQTKDLNDINDPMSVNTPQLSPCKNLNTQLNFEALNLEHNNKTALINPLTNSTTRQSSDLPEHYFKDMEGYESGSSRHSNESAFEKEYETFINRITHETSTKAHDKSKETDQEVEFAQNVQDFSKFYKRKRKLKEDELKSSTPYQQNKKKLKSSMIAKHKNSNFPEVYTKKSRNRFTKKSSTLPPRRKHFSFYYKVVRSLRRIDLKRLQRARDYLIELKEKHLPLIKRQSIKNYSHCLNDSLFKPQTLKALCIGVINTEEFRQRIINLTRKEEKKQPSSCLEADNDKHICPDPTCETCEVLRSLMASETFATPALEPPNESVTGQLEEESQEKITVIDEELNIVDLNLKNDEYIVISTDDENLEYGQENLQILDVTKTVPDNNGQSNLEAEEYFEVSSVVSPAKVKPDVADQFCLEIAEVDDGPVIPTTVHDTNMSPSVEINIENESTVPDLKILISDHKIGEMVEEPKTLSSPAKQPFKDTEKENGDSDSCDSDSESSTDSTSSSSGSSSSSSSSRSSTSSEDEGSEDEDKENSIRTHDNKHLASVEDYKNENKKHDFVQTVDPKRDDQETSVIFQKSESLESSDSEVDDIVTKNMCQQRAVNLGNPETKCSVENSMEKLLDASAKISTDIRAENSRSIGFQDPIRSLDSESSGSEREDDEKVKKTSENSSNDKDINAKTGRVDIAISDDESMNSIDSEEVNNHEELKSSMKFSTESDIIGENQHILSSDQQFLTEHQETHQDELENMGLKNSPAHENLSEDSLTSEEDENSNEDIETGKNFSTNPQTVFPNETKANTSNVGLDLSPSLKYSHENLSEDSLSSEEDENSDNDLEAGKNISTKPTNFDEPEPICRNETKDGVLDLSIPLEHSNENLSVDFHSSGNEDSDNDLETDKNISTKPINLDEPEPMFKEEAKENIGEGDLSLSMPLKDSCENLSEDSSNSEEDETSDNDFETTPTNFKESATNFRKESKENSVENTRYSNEEERCPVSNQESCGSHSARDVEIPTLSKDSHENLSEDSLSSENNENSDNDIDMDKNLSTSPTDFDKSGRTFVETSKFPEIQRQHSNKDDLYPHDNISEYSLSSVENDNSDTDMESVKSVDETEEMFTKEASEHTAEKLSYSEVSLESSFKEDFHSEQTSLEKDNPEQNEENIAEVNFKLRTPLEDRHYNHSEGPLSSGESENSDSDIDTDTNSPNILEDFIYPTLKETVLEKESKKSQNSLLENNMEISKENDLVSMENLANKFPNNVEEFNSKSMKIQQSQVLESEKKCENTSEENNSNETFHHEVNEFKRETFEDDFMQLIVREYRRAQVSENIENLVSLVNSNQNPEVVLPARETLLEFSIGNKTLENPEENLEANKLNEESALDIDQQEIDVQSVPALMEGASVSPANKESSECTEQNVVKRDDSNEASVYYSDSDSPIAELHAKNINTECKDLEALHENSAQCSESDESISEMKDTDNTKGQRMCRIPESLNKAFDQDAKEEIEASELNSFAQENKVNDNDLKETDIQIGHTGPSSKSESIAKDDENIHNSVLKKEFSVENSKQQEDIEIFEQQPKEHLEQEEADIESEAQETVSILEESLTKLDKIDKEAYDSMNQSLDLSADNLSSEFSKAKEQTEVIRTEDNLSEYIYKESAFGTTVLEPNTSEEFDSPTAEKNPYKGPQVSKETFNCSTTEKTQTNLEHLLASSSVIEGLNPQILENLEKEDCKKKIEKSMEDSQSSSFISNIANKSETEISESLEEEIDPMLYTELTTSNVPLNTESEVKVTQEYDTKDLTTETSSEVVESNIGVAQEISNTTEVAPETEKSQMEVFDNSGNLSVESEIPPPTTEGEAVSEIKSAINLESLKDRSDFSNETEAVLETLELEKEIVGVPTELSIEKEIPPNTIAVGLVPELNEDICLKIQKEMLDVLTKPCGVSETSQTVEETVPETIDNNSLEIQKEIFDTSTDSSEEQQNSQTKTEVESKSEEIEPVNISEELCVEKKFYQSKPEAESIPETEEDISAQIQKEFNQIRIRTQSESVLEELENTSMGVQKVISEEQKAVSQNMSKMAAIPDTVKDVSQVTQKRILHVSTESEDMENSQTTPELNDAPEVIEENSLEIQKQISDVSASPCGEKEIPHYPTEAEDEHCREEKIFLSTDDMEENPETIDNISKEIQKEIPDVSTELKVDGIPQPTIAVETDSEMFRATSLEIQKKFFDASAIPSGEKEIPFSSAEIEEKSFGEKEISQSKSDTEDILETLEDTSMVIQNESLDVSTESEQQEFPQITTELETDSKIIDGIPLEIQKEISNVSDTSCEETTEAITAFSCEKRTLQLTTDMENIAETVEDSSHMCTEISVEEQSPYSSSIQDTVPETYENRSLETQKQIVNYSPESSEEIPPIAKIVNEMKIINEQENCGETLSSFVKLSSPEELRARIESSNKFCVERDAIVQPSEQNSKAIGGKGEALADNDNLRNSTESPHIALSLEGDTASNNAKNSIEECGELQNLSRKLDTVATFNENSETITKDNEEDSSKSAQHSKTDHKISNEKESTTEEEFSGDFYGFKNQSSFEDESEDFHGFEDLEEVARIRQEIEQLNEDSTANDGFLNYAMLNKELHKTSTNSLSAGSSGSEINELEALEKELSQHQTIAAMEEDDNKKNETEIVHLVKVKAVSTNDIEHIKQMLESDEELHQPDEDEKKDNSKVKFEENSTSNPKDILNDIIKPVNVNSIIPKLSDLCRAALNSSLHSNRNLCDTEATPTVLVERELSVEEALAEMYRQAGVLLSDPEDCDNETAAMANEEAHDVLLINLQEILNSDNNDVYVLQCDMNDSVLNVMPANDEEQNAAALDNSGGRQPVQFIGILDTQNNEPQIHIISSDSESEVIILSDDDDDETDFVYRPFVAQHERVAIPFINDNDNVNCGNGNDSLSDISTIHHEEIVPDNLNKFLQEEFYKYLHEKYVQRNISKYYHANRVIKKYRKRYVKTKKH